MLSAVLQSCKRLRGETSGQKAGLWRRILFRPVGDVPCCEAKDQLRTGEAWQAQSLPPQASSEPTDASGLRFPSAHLPEAPETNGYVSRAKLARHCTRAH